MSQDQPIGDERVAKVHDLFLELGRVELELEQDAGRKCSDRERRLRDRRSELLEALNRLAA